MRYAPHLGCGASFVAILLLSPLAGQKALAAPLTQASSSPRPNILFIMADDHASHAIGAYGGRLAELNPTPNIDQLAHQGMLFKNVFCNNSICTPSRASILTGQYSQANSVRVLDEPLPPARQYLPLEMRKLGYTTAMIGKWHLTEEPAAFDFYEVLPGQGKYFDPTFDVRGPKPWPQNSFQRQGYVSDIITDLGIDWLEKRDPSKPFFLMLHHKAPHDMFEYAPRYSNYLANMDIPEPASLYVQPHFGSVATRGTNDSLIHEIGTSVSKRNPDRNAGSDFGVDQNLPEREYTHKAYQAYLHRYLRCVKGLDDNIGRLLDYLKQRDLLDNTIIVYTSDQGLMLGEHDYIDKRWMYEESMRMPFILRYPKIISPQSANELLINNTDFAPTLLALAGGKATPAYMQGHNFAPALSGLPLPDWRTATYYRYWMHLVHHDNPAHFGIRTKDYKLIFYCGLPIVMADIGKPTMVWTTNSITIQQTPAAWELYDLRHDPFETNNVYGDSKYKQVAAGLKAQLKATRSELNETDAKYPHIQTVIDAHWND
jgi:arylsulfatase A-like enzyme